MVVVKKTNMPWYITGLHFACQQCGQCCCGPQEGVIWISRQEIKLLAKYLGQTPREVRKKYLQRINFHFSIKENPCSKNCVFLITQNDSKSCAIYDVRPMQCRTWPFWPANLNSPNDWNTAIARCPGIYPVRDKESEIPDGHQRSPVSNGVNKGRLYTFDEIEKIKNNDCLAAAGTAAQGRDNCLAVAGTAATLICSEVKQIYDWLDSNIKSLNNQCAACGKCCCFESFDHKLFVTTPELLYFSKNVKNLKPMLTQTPLEARRQRRLTAAKGGPPLTGQTCPYLEGDKCTVRNYRFAGCRIFFCKADKDLQNKLSEETIGKFKALCDKSNFPYRYVDLATALNSSEMLNLIES